MEADEDQKEISQEVRLTPADKMSSLLLIALLAQSSASPRLAEALPRFEDYSVAEIFKGTPARPILRTPGQRMYRTRIRDAAKEGPNFAGHYKIAEWGCGTTCVEIAVIDTKTGLVSEGPFGALPGGALMDGLDRNYDRDASGKYVTAADAGYTYDLNSRLLIVRGCPNFDFDHCAAHFYEWTGVKFNLLLKVPATKRIPN